MQVRPAKREDLSSMIELMRQFAEYENLIEHFEATETSLANVMFGSRAFVNALVAESDDSIVAYALFYPNFASFRGQRGIYIEDIFVSAENQGKGIGEKLLRQIAQIAKENGFERIDFQVLEWNKRAISFYEKLGGVRDDIERHFKFTDEAFQRLAGQ